MEQLWSTGPLQRGAAGMRAAARPRNPGRRAGRVMLSFVIVTFRSNAILPRALASIPSGCEIILVDNPSDEDPAAVLGGRAARILRNARNSGYGAACNRGVAAASHPLVVVMNPDVTLDPGAVEAFLAAAAAHPDVDFFSPTIFDETGRENARQQSWIEAWTRADRRRNPVALGGAGADGLRFLHGAVFLARRTAYCAVGGFDERIFLYYEDDDLSWRILRSGRTMRRVPGAVVRHQTGSSSGHGFGDLFRRGRHKKRSEIYIARKWGLCHSPASDLAVQAAKLAFYGVTLQVDRFAGALGRLAALLGRPAEGRRTVPGAAPPH
nr:glycosyltransferase family 2 protein [Prosthecomicrobium pneumaticum]